ncbi:MAG TPA: hypothetical protein VLY63_31325 [Anaerolineae bacterium]|nr:hypothetical protein [Anaerolineae bacterium]
MRRNTLLLALALALGLVTLGVAPALAHRPYFEDDDIGADQPWEIDDPSISTALYATLESATDVDYYSFEGLEREVILLAMTIPQIEGQDAFAPTMALIGPGLPEAQLPDGVAVPEGAGALLIEPPPGPAPTFHEPFSRTSYWERQEQRVTLPSSGQYVVAVWHPDGEAGRYTFVIGEKERLGGDLTFPIKMRSYWTPVEAPPVEQAPEFPPTRHSCGGQ